jgi:hypothetical protein
MGIRYGRWLVAASLVLGGWCAVEAQAQQPGGALPFGDIYRRPNISAYNQISNFSNNPQQSQNIYQQLVKPQLDQQRQQVEQINQRRSLGGLQNQVTQIQRDTRSRQIDPTIRPTGHASTYMNYSHFYPQRR